MARLEWSPQRPYYGGVDCGVLYLANAPGIAWNGLVSVTDVPSSGKGRSVYFDGKLAGFMYESEEFNLAVSAYTYPKQFLEYSGFSGIRDNQGRKYFNFSYRTGDSLTGQLHLVYNAKATPSSKDWKSKSRASNETLFNWDITTRPTTVPGVRPTAHIVVDLESTPAITVDELENYLYGTATNDPTFPAFATLLDIFSVSSGFVITDNGNGTWTAESSDSNIKILANGRVEITYDTVIALDTNTYRMSTAL